MCKCAPEIRTPFCGRGNCLPPGFANLSEWLGISDDEAEAAAQANLDRVWAQAVRQSQVATSEQPTKLTAQEAQQLFVELAALRTQLEQAQAELDRHKRINSGWKDEYDKMEARWEQAEARETALRDALEELVGAHDRWFDTGMGEGQAIAATAKAKELLGEH